MMAWWTLFALAVPSTIYSMMYRTPFVARLFGFVLLGIALEAAFGLLHSGRIKLRSASSGLTAALIVASIPPTVPFLPVFYAILVALFLAKFPSQNTLRFNPAMVGRLFLMLVYNDYLVGWGDPETTDGLTSATPLDLLYAEDYMVPIRDLLSGKLGGTWEEIYNLVPGSPGEMFVPVILLLGLVLWRMGILTWRTPLAFLASFAAACALMGEPVIFHLLSGSVVFTAVFIVSDPLSTPATKSGRIIAGVIVGVANACMRHYTYYAEGVVFAVLFANLFTPTLDRLAFTLQGRKLQRRRKRFDGTSL